MKAGYVLRTESERGNSGRKVGRVQRTKMLGAGWCRKGKKKARTRGFETRRRKENQRTEKKKSRGESPWARRQGVRSKNRLSPEHARRTISYKKANRNSRQKKKGRERGRIAMETKKTSRAEEGARARVTDKSKHRKKPQEIKHLRGESKAKKSSRTIRKPTPLE